MQRWNNYIQVYGNCYHGEMVTISFHPPTEKILIEPQRGRVRYKNVEIFFKDEVIITSRKFWKPGKIVSLQGKVVQIINVDSDGLF